MSDMDSSSESEDEIRISIHEAKYTTDNKGYIYDKKVLDLLKVDDIVRISFRADVDYKWTHDSPFMKILEITDDDILGELLNINRYQSDMYPIVIGDKIWFNLNNIIEIPLDISPNTRKISQFKPYLTNNRLLCTGPLCTTLDPDDESSVSDSSDEKNENFSDISED